MVLPAVSDPKIQRVASLGQSYFVLVFLFFYQSNFCGASSNEWSYNEEEGNGPSSWFNKYPACGGEFQSPVDIKGAQNSGNLSSLVFDKYDQILKNADLVNNGHSVKLSASDSQASLSGGCLGTDTYDFLQFHFHWGSNDSVGSEHTVNGLRFPMEAHFVHVNRKYGDLAEAVKHPDGLAVLGIFYTSTDTTAKSYNALIQGVSDVSQKALNEHVTLKESLTLQELMPKDLSRFYCYEKGSLTTPACQEAVTWTLMEEKIPLSKKQLEEFRKLRFEGGTPMVNNFRPIQPLNGRTIYYHG